jgi:Cu/Ag efflux protein CusF
MTLKSLTVAVCLTVVGLAALPVPSTHAQGEKKAAKRDQLFIEGKVAAIDFKAKTITVERKGGRMTFQVPDSCDIFVKNVPTLAKLSHLKVGDSVNLFYVEENGELIAKRIGEQGAHADKKENRVENNESREARQQSK